MKATSLDLARYPRRAHFDYFRSLADPFLGVTVQVDVTRAVSFCRTRGCSFFLCMLRAAALAANRVPELRRRIRGAGIVEYDRCGTSHVELLEDGTYCYCTVHHDPEEPLSAYLTRARGLRAASRAAASIEEEAEVEGLFFVSTLPWLHYTELRQPTAGPAESNPRLTWGKYEEDHRGRLLLPLTVLCHHALVDGLHLAQFYRAVDEELERLVREN